MEFIMVKTLIILLLKPYKLTVWMKLQIVLDAWSINWARISSELSQSKNANIA